MSGSSICEWNGLLYFNKPVNDAVIILLKILNAWDIIFFSPKEGEGWGWTLDSLNRKWLSYTHFVSSDFQFGIVVTALSLPPSDSCQIRVHQQKDSRSVHRCSFLHARKLVCIIEDSQFENLANSFFCNKSRDLKVLLHMWYYPC